MSYLGEDLSTIIYEEFKDLVLDATLTVVSSGTRTPGSLTGGTNPTTATHSCKGYVSTWTDKQLSQTLVQDGDRKIVLLADSLTVTPKPGDKITINSNDYIIREQGVMIDPSTSIYTCHCGVV